MRAGDRVKTRPVIGITAYVEPARWGVWEMRAVLVPESYVLMVTQAGGRAVVLPPDPAGAADLVRRLDAALAADLPVLGVCRGMELLAVAYDGKLHQHLPDVLGGANKHAPAPGVYGSHLATFAPGSIAAAVFGGQAEVNSYHHQAV